MNGDIVYEIAGAIIALAIFLFPIWILVAITIYKIYKNKRELEKFNSLSPQQKEEELKHRREIERWNSLTPQQKEAELKHRRSLEIAKQNYEFESQKKERKFESDVEKEIERLNQKQYHKDVNNEAKRRIELNKNK